MENLSQLRERYLDYNKNQFMGQRGGGNNDSDTDSVPEDRPYMVAQTTENPNSIMLEETRKAIMKSKSEFYNSVISKAPSPLDQSLVLNTILETDMATIAKVLIQALSNLNMRFKTCLMDVYNRNNHNLHVEDEDMKKYSSLINKEAITCISTCRATINNFNTQTQNQNTEACKELLQDIFVTYPYTQYNPPTVE